MGNLIGTTFMKRLILTFDINLKKLEDYSN